MNRSRPWLLILILITFIIVPATPGGRAQQGREVRVRPKGDLVELPGRSKRWALIIGVDKYDSTRITPLIGASNDAEKLADALVKYAGFPADQVVVISSSQPEALKPKRNIIIERLANLNGVVPEDGLFLFAFSGHGTEAEEKGYLLPSDAVSAERNARLLEQTAIPVNYVRDEIRSFGVRQVIVLLDSCRNDPRADKAGGDHLMAPPLAESFDFDRRNSEVEGFVTFYATRSRMRAYEDPVRRQGYFSYAFIEGLAGRAANERGEVTLAGLIRYLEEKVPLYVKRDQGARAQQAPRTVVEGYRASDLVLSVAAPPKPPPPPVATAEAIELAFWNSISGSENVKDFEAYIEAYPNGRFIRLARNQRDQLLVKVGSRLELSVVSTPVIRTVSFDTIETNGSGDIERRLTRSAYVFTQSINNSISTELVRIISGSFKMGSPENESLRRKDELQHDVSLDEFYIGRYEVTQAQWKAVMGSLPPGMSNMKSDFIGDQLPVIMVSWDEAVRFCSRLNEILKLSGARAYRLPTEAEWEYAARGGSNAPFAFGPTIYTDVVNYDGAYPYGSADIGKAIGHPVAVGSYPPNSFGLYDTAGNVSEWCNDWYGDYPETSVTNPHGPSTGEYKVFRGGSWTYLAVGCRSAYRSSDYPNSRYHYMGFRIAKTLR